MKKPGILMICVIICLTFTGCGMDGSNPHNTMLQELGVDTDVGKMLDPAGEPVASTYNPVSKKVKPLNKQSEIFFGGADTTSAPDSYNGILNWESYESTDFTMNTLTGDNSWIEETSEGLYMTSGDFDADGVDEICTAVWDYATGSNILRLRIIENTDTSLMKNSPAYTVVADRTMTGIVRDENLPWYDERYKRNAMSISSGDMDGNGESEIIIACGYSIYMISGSSQGYTLLKTISFPEYESPEGEVTYVPAPILKTATGDINGDSMDELVLVYNKYLMHSNSNGNFFMDMESSYHIYSGPDIDELNTGSISVTENSTTVELQSGNCTVGDIDADGLSEILFIGDSWEGYNIMMIMMIMDPRDSKTGEMTYTIRNDYESITYSNSGFPPICAIADFDGDGMQEFIGYIYLYDNLSESGGTFRKDYRVSDICESQSYYAYNISIGDIDGDSQVDIAYISNNNYLYYRGFSTAKVWTTKKTFYMYNLQEQPVTTEITVGNFDGNDTIAIKYISSEVLFSDPRIITVLASSPFWEGLDMEGETFFATASGSGSEAGVTAGLSVGVSVGFETEGPFGAWKAAAKRSIQASLDWSASISRTVMTTYSYSTENEDKVIFATIPFDVFYYQVVSAPPPANAGDEPMTGKMIAISVPRSPIVLPVERKYYNDHNGSNPDVHLSHLTGNPFTYPSYNQALALISSGGGEGVISGTLCAGHGTGGTGIEISVETSMSASVAFDISNTVEVEAGAGGFVAGVNYGYHLGFDYTITTTDSTTYGGYVGNIPDTVYNNSRIFKWGIFSYQGNAGDDKYIAVQYYTQRI